MNKIWSFGIASFLLIGLTACDILDKDEPLPGYITINDIEFNQENTAVTGYGRTKITDAWFSINGVRKGVFEMPARFAVNEAEAFDIKVDAGIEINGISATREIYPFYSSWEPANNPISISDLDEIVLTPEISYRSNCIFPLTEGFESSVLDFDSVAGSDINIQRIEIEENPYNQRYVGLLEISEDHPGAKITTSNSYELPTGADNPVYLELEYNSNQLFVVSIIADYATGSDIDRQVLYIGATKTNDSGEHVWNKIYVELTPTVSEYFGAEGYKVSFTASYDETLNENGKIYLDNIKVVHR